MADPGMLRQLLDNLVGNAIKYTAADEAPCVVLTSSQDEEPGWARALLDETAEAMSGAVFAATPGSQCGTCQVKDACPTQSEGRFL